MTRIKTSNQKSLYDSLNKRLDKYENAVDTTLNSYNERIAVLVAASSIKDSGDNNPFTFSRSSNKSQLNNVVDEAKMALYAAILAHTKTEWTNSNETQDDLIDKSVKRYLTDEQIEEYSRDNEDELKRFQERSDDGLTVYGRLKNHTDKYKSCVEAAIALALLSGATLGAAFLASKIKSYLHNFDKLYKDYTKRYGEKKNLHNAVYFIKKLVRSEANMAYRRAEQLRWRQWPFVIGYRICLSKSHRDQDICDLLKGEYPKTFIWTGWHPNDRCFCVPILQSKETLSNGEKAKQITDTTSGFKRYIYLNHERIKNAKINKTLPYYLKDNEDFWYQQFKNAETTTTDGLKAIRKRRREIQRQAEVLKSEYITHPNFDKRIRITKKGVKEWLNQPHQHYSEKNELLLDINRIFSTTEYIGYGQDKHDKGIKMHLFKVRIKGDDSWIVVREFYNGVVTLHGISDSYTIARYITHKYNK